MEDYSENNLEKQFRLALREIAATVAVITAKDDSRRYGMTVTSVTSLSMGPPSLLVCLNRAASIINAARVAQDFCVNILSQGHEDVSTAFSGGAEGEDRFSVGHWRENKATGLPYLQGAQAALFCRKTAAMPYGTHTILIGDVEEIIVSDVSSPLLYWNAGYAKLGGHRTCVSS